MENSQKRYLISDIETLYLHTKPENVPRKVNMIIYLTLFIYVTTDIISNYFIFFITTPRSKIYCFNFYSNKLELCDISNVCQTGYYTFFMDFSKNKNYQFTDNTLEQLNKLNKNYSTTFKSFFEDTALQMYNRLKPEISYFSNISLVVYFSEKEPPSFILNFHQLCNQITESTFIIGFCFLGLIISNLFLSFLSDAFGRKKMLLIGLFITFLGTLGMIIYYLILNIKTTSIVNNAFELSEYFKLDQTVQEYYADKKILLLISIFLIFTGKSLVSNNSFTLLLEYSFNDSEVKNNFLFSFIFRVVVFYFSYILCYRINEFIYSLMGSQL